MMLRKLGLAVAVASAAAAGVYFFVYLVRWEWNRALVSAVIFVAVEILVLGAALMSRMARLERAVGSPAPAPAPNLALAQLRANRPPAGRPFAWLDPKRSGTNVFVPVLMGAGLVVSALAWLVERVARLVARPGMEVSLAGQLNSIAYPAHLVQGDPQPPSAVALLDGPVGRR